MKGLMTAFNRLGLQHVAAHRGLMNGILQGEWGFRGMILTDSVKSAQYFLPRETLLAGNNMMLGGANSKVTNEIDVINSRGMMQRVVEDLGLNYAYSKRRPLKTLIFYKNNPFVAIVDSTENYPNPPAARITFVPQDSSTYRILSIETGGSKYPIADKVYRFGEEFSLKEHKVAIERSHLAKFEIGDKYIITMRSPINTARPCAGNFP